MCENKRQLTDQELDSASGGDIMNDTLDMLRRMANGEKPTSLVKNAQMQEIGSYWGGQLYYYPCAQCGHPMHAMNGGALLCNACRNISVLPPFAPWNGTEQELRAAAG